MFGNRDTRGNQAMLLPASPRLKFFNFQNFRNIQILSTRYQHKCQAKLIIDQGRRGEKDEVLGLVGCLLTGAHHCAAQSATSWRRRNTSMAPPAPTIASLRSHILQ